MAERVAQHEVADADRGGARRERGRDRPTLERVDLGSHRRGEVVHQPHRVEAGGFGRQRALEDPVEAHPDLREIQAEPRERHAGRTLASALRWISKARGRSSPAARAVSVPRASHSCAPRARGSSCSICVDAPDADGSVRVDVADEAAVVAGVRVRRRATRRSRRRRAERGRRRQCPAARADDRGVGPGLNVNLRGAFVCLRGDARHDPDARDGSTHGRDRRGHEHLGFPERAAHGALRGLEGRPRPARALARHASSARAASACNAVAPGTTDTPMFAATDRLPGYREQVAAGAPRSAGWAPRPRSRGSSWRCAPSTGSPARSSRPTAASRCTARSIRRSRSKGTSGDGARAPQRDRRTRLRRVVALLARRRRLRGDDGHALRRRLEHVVRRARVASAVGLPRRSGASRRGSRRAGAVRRRSRCGAGSPVARPVVAGDRRGILLVVVLRRRRGSARPAAGPRPRRRAAAGSSSRARGARSRWRPWSIPTASSSSSSASRARERRVAATSGPWFSTSTG